MICCSDIKSNVCNFNYDEANSSLVPYYEVTDLKDFENVRYSSNFSDFIDKMSKNISKIKKIENLEDNWNNNGAIKIPKNAIVAAIYLVTNLEFQPELFPTANGSIQLEYDKYDNSYFEIEIFDKFAEIFKLNKNGEEFNKKVYYDNENFHNLECEFYE